MAGWQDLYRMLLDESVSAAQIIDRLNIPPSRVRRLLGSRRLRQRLEAADDLVERAHSQRLMKNMEQVSHRLIDLADSEKPETARRACEHLLAECQKLIVQNHQAKFVPEWMR